ncbi:tellurite resistance TerB family protein [Denitrobaculum tricleocarpae]|uniref:Tellurite resistance TerB family protein n=1 Tax=Denitrobaculum tricleocarpae TaxID=2591009 RepID=A0A545TAU4_9PROT|nr:tellurite resistance TerB family protein [Denitrobaculum tricleocarpae]TQV74343.1 tellurite resistance TerB family protein [Denitrobaculum tricleocarpae]
MNPQSLLEQFLGTGAGQGAGQGNDAGQGGHLAQGMGGALSNAKDKLAGSGVGGIAGGLAAGGLMGLLLGNKKARKSVGKVAGGVAAYGGAAALGALAFRAYQNWQSGQTAGQGAGQAAGHSMGQQANTQIPRSAPQAHLPPPQELPMDSKFLPAAAPAQDGRPFELAMVLAMIGAANADGHIGPDEQRHIFDQVGKLPLDAEDKAFVFDALSSPPSLQDIAGLAKGPEQAAELYLVSRLAIDPDHPMEQAYLEALASRLNLPKELVAHLEAQVEAQASTVPV